jgi:FkbM family methyltransferase
MPKLPRKRSSGLKSISRELKSVIRTSLLPVTPWLPDQITNSFPSLGRVSACDPSGRRFQMISDGDDGKDYIAYKVAGKCVDIYETETTRVILQLLKNTRCFLDIGANTGLFAMLAACNPSCRVIAFEPVPQIAARLQANATLNRYEHLSVEAVAVTNRDGTIVLHVPATKASLPTSASTVEEFRGESQPITVPAISLDRYVQQHGIEHVDLMKIDTETTEYQVLEGAAALLQRDEPAMVCEVLPQTPEPAIIPALERLLRPLGYRYFWITAAGLQETARPLGDEQNVFNNYLFIPPRRMSQVAHLIAAGPVAESV